ncbi:hypothetical protein TREMEDRAFT_74889 [Tremella mesenterica DSM 1558]|uniref:uncharacterized protein n=1 Tax=Tremella mesenterica (strain ATCC 24925 / CBS 8224 / DSM 1558 / NBRC 9311 / NRRL Y-6157 / RJB 2259-6 / UBC 559-6) TaxID=578456 RepID=UPI00032BAD2F|nr:uncharacterized protein TREMEDRAFT_74889 [Tremella mesenterica DSM 1558]EIW65961.1 hypothetical protein TREMEDRAFT_74889 [Tremella mesenterica DSM 1558]
MPKRIRRGQANSRPTSVRRSVGERADVSSSSPTITIPFLCTPEPPLVDDSEPKNKMRRLDTPQSVTDEDWQRDFEECRVSWEVEGDVEGFVGMIATVSRFRSGKSPHSVQFDLEYGDVEGDERTTSLTLVFKDIEDYPETYYLDISGLTGRLQKRLSRFVRIYNLDIQALIVKLLSALQGDDEANGGRPSSLVPDNGDPTESMEDLDALRASQILSEQEPPDMVILNRHFTQAKSMGYRPGWTKVSDFWVYSLSIPLKNLPIDPNTLAMWDDDLVEAWKQDKRIVLLVGVTSYPPKLDGMRYWLGLNDKYKPSEKVCTLTTRKSEGGMPPFFTSIPLLGQLKFFPRCHKLRTDFGQCWAEADAIGLDEERSRTVFQSHERPLKSLRYDSDDPVTKGYELNYPLCAFWWVIRRFVNAPKCCLNCGLPVTVPSLRPYVCNSPLCVYGYMSLGLGPSIEHVIKTEPEVVDLLLSFAYAAAQSKARMDLPLQLNIDVPKACTGSHDILFDLYEKQRSALAWLIEQLPPVSQIKEHLNNGGLLKDIDAPAGSIGVLRWVVGSCRAYLKAAKPHEGVQNAPTVRPGEDSGCFRQFLFVVGSPQQESRFKEEVEKAQKNDKNCLQYPTLLAYHGSGVENWHNILRTGLDFQDTANGRAYGHGVYFAAESSISMNTYARANTVQRENADFVISKATALVELVNVPKTFISRNPYYVVGNIRQIRPFMLLVQGKGEISPAPQYKGALFQHDPKLAMKTTFSNSPLLVAMPEKLTPATFVDNDPYDSTDEAILSPLPLQPTFTRSDQARYDRLGRMAPPEDTSLVATRALSKEFKTLVRQQESGENLPFYLDREGDSLYCWTLELWDFPKDSRLMQDMKKFDLRSIIAEIRFPSSFPHSPPFMRILHPRFLPFAQGGGGNITAGGSVCNEILTSTGWNPAFCIEAIVRDIMTNMTEAIPPARLDPHGWDRPYSMSEALEAFKRVAAAHGWGIPKDLDKMTTKQGDD